MKLVIQLFIFLCTSVFFGAHAQNLDDHISSLVDSLDGVQISPIAKTKCKGCAHVIKVSSQVEFDAINDRITQAIEDGWKSITIKLRNGVYHFHDNHIHRKNEHTDVKILIQGKHAVLTSDNNYVSHLDSARPWRETERADDLIEVIDKKNKLCFLPFANTFTNKEKSSLTKVRITSWFYANTYDVKSIDSRGIYFVAPNLEYIEKYGKKTYNVNYDYIYANAIPRFRLYDKAKERYCGASRFIDLQGSSYSQFIVKGICFDGNKGDASLIYIGKVNADKILIEDCLFSNIRNLVAEISNSDNVVINRNQIKGTELSAINFSKGCKNARITDNVFEQCGQEFRQTFCVNCNEAEYYIAHNIFRDFGYAAIGVGVWHGRDKTLASKGIIEHNEIYFTPEYFANAWKHMLMDSGAIYVWTQNDNVVIRYNYIHDYTGAGDNRGIFCDDGANNLKIYRNVVTNIPNSYCIDSRASKDQKEGFSNNANNFMAQNVMDGCVRFQGYDGENRHVVKGANYVIKGEKAIENKTENLEVNVEDVEVQGGQEVQKLKEFKKFKIKIKN